MASHKKHNKYAAFSKKRKRYDGRSVVTCIRKFSYRSDDVARAAAERIGQKTGRSLSPYFCAVCQKYHLASA